MKNDTGDAEFRTRLATEDDLPMLRTLMAEAIESLQQGFLTPAQIAASKAVMGLDTQLVADGTYFVVEDRCGRIAGCGGWSRRATLYGGDHSAALRDPKLLDPAKDPARIRAMYTDPAFTRRGIGRLILATCEQAAAEAGFASVELMGTLSGVPLYRACGYVALEEVATEVDGVSVPFVRMRKGLIRP